MIPVSLAQLTISGTPPADVVSAAAAAGFEKVGLRLEARLKHEDFPHPAAGNPAALAEIARRLRASGLIVSNVTGNYLVPETRREDLERLAESGAAISARYVVMVSYDPDEGRTADNLALLAEIAAQAGMKIALEFITYNYVRDLPQAWRIAKRTGNPNVGLMIDALHLSRSGGSPADLAALDRSRLFIAQLCDASGPPPDNEAGRINESRTARLHPGQGDLPLFAFLDAFPPEADIELEAPHPDHLDWAPERRAKAAAQTLRQFLADYENRRSVTPAQG